jgi:hypothetical protein
MVFARGEVRVRRSKLGAWGQGQGGPGHMHPTRRQTGVAQSARVTRSCPGSSCAAAGTGTHLTACSKVHSDRLVGLESGKMMGRSFISAIVRITCRRQRRGCGRQVKADSTFA